MALVIDSLETSKRALHSPLSTRVIGASSPATIACFERKIDAIDLGLARAAAPGGVRPALEAADQFHQCSIAPPLSRGRRPPVAKA